MSEQPVTSLPADSLFPSLAALRARHSKLLEAHRTQADSDAFWQEVTSFLHRGSRSGALFDREEDRWSAQSLLDYWSATAYSVGHTMPDAALVDFDPTLAPLIPDAQCPYVGLAAFHEGREKFFFGRERLLNTLVAQVAAARLVAVVGPSGSGKSSLVLAGLIPLLKQGAIAGTAAAPDSAQWHYLPRLVPGSEPLVNLAAVLQPVQDSAQLNLTHAADALVNLLNSTRQEPAVLVIDQFEELFTLCTDEAVRTAFIHQVLTLVEAPGPRHTVILTMRTDFESFVARVPALLPHFERALVRVTPLNAAELRAVIEKPAELVGLKFEAGIIDALVQDVLGEPAALPLLQFTLLKLWEARDRNRITWETYKRLGGGRLALARSADQLYDSLIPEDQVTARRILLRLVRPGEGLEVTSNRIRQRVLYQTGEARDRVDRVLHKLVAADLIRLTTGERPEDTQVEVAHEALVRNWPRLVGWLEDERARLRERLRVTDAAEQWLALGRDPGALLRGAPLEEALQYTDLNELEQAYIQASQAALAVMEQEKEANRQRTLEQALALAKEQERLAKSERQWAEFQAKTAATLRRRLILLGVLSAIALLLAAAVFLFYSQANARRAEAEAQATIAATARQEAEMQATAAEQARRDAVAQAATAQAAQATAQVEAAAARTAEAELQAKQDRLRHLAAALSYTGEQINQLEQLLSSLSATVDHTTQLPDNSADGDPRSTPIAPALTPTTTLSAPPLQETPVAVTRPEIIARQPLPPMPGLTATTTLTTTTDQAGVEPLDMVNAALLPFPVTETVVADAAVAIPVRLQNVIAIVPDVDINLYSEASEKAPVLRTLRAPDQLTVLQADTYWVQAATADGLIGWVEAYWLTYAGDTTQLPRALQYRVETTLAPTTQNDSKIPFPYGQVISVDNATAYPVLDDPYNGASQLTVAPVGTAVTLLFAADGPVNGGSTLWYYVQLADPAGKNVLWQGYLPAAVIAPRG